MLSRWCEDKAAEMMARHWYDAAGDYLELAAMWKSRGM